MTREYTLVDAMRDELLAHIRYLEDECTDLLELVVFLQDENTALHAKLSNVSTYNKTICPICGYEKCPSDPHVCIRRLT